MTDGSRTQRGQRKRPRRKSKRYARLNPKNQVREATIDIVDRLLLAPVQTTLNGKVTTMKAIQAIIYQLILKEKAGDARASSALLKYKALDNRVFRKRLEVVFADSDNGHTDD